MSTLRKTTYLLLFYNSTFCFQSESCVFSFVNFGNLSAFQMIFVKQKPKFLERPIRKERVPREPIKTKKETSKLRKARENARD